jgi:hypothetical protein
MKFYRHREVAAVGATAVVLGAGAFVALRIADGGAPRHTDARQSSNTTVASRAQASSVNSTTSLSPSYLPAGATVLSTSPLHGAPNLAANNPASSAQTIGQVRTWSLGGAANSSTIPAGGSTPLNQDSIHQSTELQLVFEPGVTQLPSLPIDPKYFDMSTVSIGGNSAVLSVDKTGIGNVRIDWVDGAGYHILMCDRLRTDQGLSGLSADDLVKVASSLYQ